MLRKFCLLLCCLLGLQALALATSPKLPASNGPVTIMVQDDPAQPARALMLHLRYPHGKLANVTDTTGLMLDLHNWGGMTFDGAVSPETLAAAYDVVAIGVQYFQSGDKDKDPQPYDFGYVQAMDALRGLQFVYRSLRDADISFDATRIYGTGGSGGGNVIQMANKFAPHTFACIVDLSGMSSLTDDIAYNLPGGSGLNARYSRDPANPAYLTKGMQEIRDLGNPAHLALLVKGGNRCKIVMLHGEDDGSCLAADTHRVADAMHAVGLNVETHFFSKADIDGKLVLNTGHSIGNRTALLQHFAGDYLLPTSPKLCRLTAPCDFDQRKLISYPTSDGVYTISFPDGLPTVSFAKK